MFRRDRVEMQVWRAAAAFHGAGAMPFVGQEMLEGRKQERTKLSAFALRPLKAFLFQDSGKEGLCEVFRILRVVTRPPHVSVAFTFESDVSMKHLQLARERIPAYGDLNSFQQSY